MCQYEKLDWFGSEQALLECPYRMKYWTSGFYKPWRGWEGNIRMNVKEMITNAKICFLYPICETWIGTQVKYKNINLYNLLNLWNSPGKRAIKYIKCTSMEIGIWEDSSYQWKVKRSSGRLLLSMPLINECLVGLVVSVSDYWSWGCGFNPRHFHKF